MTRLFLDGRPGFPFKSLDDFPLRLKTQNIFQIMLSEPFKEVAIRSWRPRKIFEAPKQFQMLNLEEAPPPLFQF